MSALGTVLVTGGSGYIAGFCIAELLRRGYRVRATVRSLAREAEVRDSLRKLIDPGDRLSFVAADLNADAGWSDAVRGAEYVLHVASPLPTVSPKNDDDLVKPARDGALRVLKAARDASVKRVVLTASIAAIAYGRGSHTTPCTEADWTDETNRADTSAYERSKTIAERAAWDFMTREGGALELVTINPSAVLGPLLGRDFSASIEFIKKLMDGTVPGVPRMGFPLVDVRDVADLHIRAMLNPEAAGQRFICAGDFVWMGDAARLLRARLPDRARRIPARNLPNWLVRLAALFDPTVRGRLFELGKERRVSSEKAKRLLGWSTRPAEETILATAQSLIAEKIV